MTCRSKTQPNTAAITGVRVKTAADDTGEAVSTELLRYGLRVAVIAIPAARALTSASALKVVGPSAFGYDVPFTPMSGTKIGERG